MAGPYGKHIFSFIRNCRSVFQSDFPYTLLFFFNLTNMLLPDNMYLLVCEKLSHQNISSMRARILSPLFTIVSSAQNNAPAHSRCSRNGC